MAPKRRRVLLTGTASGRQRSTGVTTGCHGHVGVTRVLNTRAAEGPGASRSWLRARATRPAPASNSRSREALDSKSKADPEIPNSRLGRERGGSLLRQMGKRGSPFPENPHGLSRFGRKRGARAVSNAGGCSCSIRLLTVGSAEGPRELSGTRPPHDRLRGRRRASPPHVQAPCAGSARLPAREVECRFLSFLSESVKVLSEKKGSAR